MKRKRIVSLLLAAVCLCTAAFWGAGSTSNAAAPDAGEPAESSNAAAPDEGSLGEPSDAGEPAESSDAAAWPEAPGIVTDYAILMDVGSGAVLYEKNARERRYPASITKILTAILAIENGNFSDNVTFSSDAVYKTEGSGIWRDVDEVMTLEQCMYALMLVSANECAYAIAEHVGGTYENFINMMNEKAAELGCEDTHFANPHGLPDENHYTTAYDMALISRYAIQNETFRQIVGTLRYDIPPTNKHEEITYLTQQHKMMRQSEEYFYEECIGGKTGYTDDAGNTLVTFAQKDGMTLVCVVLKERKPDHYLDTRALLDWGFANFSSRNILEGMGAVEGAASDFKSGGKYADMDKGATVALPNGVDFSALKYNLAEKDGDPDIAGELQFTYGDRLVGSVEIARPKEPEKQPEKEAQELPAEGEESAEKPSRGPWPILLLIVAAVAAAVYGLHRFGADYYLIRYQMMSKKGQKGYRYIIRRKARRRRR